MWSTIVVEVNTVAVARMLPVATGLAFSFVHGKHTGSANVANQALHKNTLVSHSSSCKLSLPPFGGFRVVITACMHSTAHTLPPSDSARLGQLGFRTGSDPDTLTLTSGVGPPPGIYSRALVELCCSASSKLGSASPESSDCLRIRFTEKEDLTTASGLQSALSAVQSCQTRFPGKLM